MTSKQTGGIVCLIVAAGLLIFGLLKIAGGELHLSDPSGLGVSRAVGTFLPGLIALIIGVKLLSKPEGNNRRRR